MRFTYMAGMKARNAINVRRSPVGVEPGMQFHAALMGFVNGILQRIPKRVRGFALSTGKVGRPGFNAAWIQGIALASYLQVDGVHTGLHVMRKNGVKTGLLLCRGLGAHRPVDTGESSDPGGPQFSFRLGK